MRAAVCCYCHYLQGESHHSLAMQEEEDYGRLLEAIFVRGDLHRHCFTCYKGPRACSKDGCDFVKCLHNCGAFFHGCKQLLHDEICPNVMVACLNRHYGCNLDQLCRKDINAHLEKCPASVVVIMSCCTTGLGNQL